MTGLQQGAALPASYEITVSGHLSPSWSSRLSGMTIVHHSDHDQAVTVLKGGVADQAALLGVLNTLFSLGLPLRSVEQLSTTDGADR